MAGGVAVDNTLGALLVSTFVSCMLFGVTTLQLYVYTLQWRSDSKWTRGLAIGIWLMDGIASAFQCHTMYFYLISQFGATEGPTIGVWSLCVMSMMETLIAAPVEFFYAARIWKLGHEVRFGRHIAALIVTFIVAHASLCFLFSAKLIQNPEMYTWQGKFYDQVVISGLVLSTIADLFISVTMIYIMRSFNTTISTSKALVNSIIRRSIESGTITSLGVIAVMVTFVTMPTNMISFALLFLLPKLYSNSMLAMLNRRQSSSGVTVNCGFDHQHASRDIIESIHFADSEKVAAISGSESTLYSAEHS
ncbi:hypothetical protein CCMSSC00406_0006016 [Pleurotus cornucopiae]|uniref:Uncharacterized protein n=1 Tax=Pleurotus cornucopiae TaxID=5321 RepID=A0ACB7INB4_PLECO|nr:hypothetical protein CCMSSC00406_0006016 [Pleurotus cornucopiae]